MLPRRNDWKSWSPLERATYLAQVAAALALLPTVVFSWLSLREARLTREDQAKYFNAEKAPLLELQSLEARDSFLIGVVKNIGDSTANDLSFWYNVSNPKMKCSISVSVDEKDTQVQKVERGQTAEFIFSGASDFSEKCGLNTKSYRIKLARSYSSSDDPPHLEILLIWKDINGESRARKYEAEGK